MCLVFGLSTCGEDLPFCFVLCIPWRVFWKFGFVPCNWRYLLRNVLSLFFIISYFCVEVAYSSLGGYLKLYLRNSSVSVLLLGVSYPKSVINLKCANLWIKQSISENVNSWQIARLRAALWTNCKLLAHGEMSTRTRQNNAQNACCDKSHGIIRQQFQTSCQLAEWSILLLSTVLARSSKTNTWIFLSCAEEKVSLRILEHWFINYWRNVCSGLLRMTAGVQFVSTHCCLKVWFLVSPEDAAMICTFSTSCILACTLLEIGPSG